MGNDKFPCLAGRQAMTNDKKERENYMDKATQHYLLNLVRENYEEIAVSFNTTRTKYLWPGLVKLTAPVRDGDKILDVGCGNGRLLHALAGKNIEYLGIDDSVRLIETAKSNWRMSANLRSGDWRFISGNILKLDKLPEKDFDYVFCVAVLHHLPGKDLRIEALRQMKEKIAPGGKIIITVWNLWQQNKFRKLISKFALLKLAGKNKMEIGDIVFGWKNSGGEAISQRYYHAFTKNEIKKAVRSAGFNLESLEKDEYNYYAILGK